MRKKEYSSPELEVVSFTLYDVLGASTNPPPFSEVGTEGGNDDFEGGL